MSADHDRVLVGEIGRAQGLKGEVRLRAFTEEPGALQRYGPLEDEQGRVIAFEAMRADAKGLVGRIEGVNSREAAEALTGTKLYVPRSRLAKPGEEEWYHADLIGLAAIAADGAPFGTVTAVHNFGAGDLLEIRPVGGSADILIPFTDAAVPELDVAGGWLKVIPPEMIE